MTEQHLKLLLVEDDSGYAFLVREMLADLSTDRSVHVHYEVTHAERVDQALVQLKEPEFDVILLDLTLPDSQGLETLRTVHAAADDIPIVVMTGFEDEELALKALADGALDYIFKNDLLSSRLLGRSIRYALERHRMTMSLNQYMHELEASETRFHNIISNNSDGMLVLDPEGLVRFVNPPVVNITQRRLEDLLEKRLGVVVKEGDTTEHSFRGETGVTTVAEMKAMKTVWEGDTAYIVSMRDITDRKRQEENHRRSQYQETFDLIASTIGANICSQLSAIVDGIDRAAGETNENEATCKSLQEAKRAAVYGATLTQQLTMLSDKYPVSLKPVQLNSLLSDLTPQLQTLYDTISVATVAEESWIRADRGQIEQVIMNMVIIIANMDAANLNSIHIETQQRQPLSPNETGIGQVECVLLTVCTAGLSTITFQPSPPRAEVNSQFGFGPYVISRVLKLHGGELSVSDDMERKPALQIALPISRQGPSLSMPRVPKKVVKSMAIALVSDELDEQKQIADILRARGYRVIETMTAAETKTQFEEDINIDLLLTEKKLADSDGVALADVLTKSNPELKVIVMREFTDNEPMQLSATRDVIDKPFTDAELLSTIAEMLVG